MYSEQYIYIFIGPSKQVQSLNLFMSESFALQEKIFTNLIIIIFLTFYIFCFTNYRIVNKMFKCRNKTKHTETHRQTHMGHALPLAPGRRVLVQTSVEAEMQFNTAAKTQSTNSPIICQSSLTTKEDPDLQICRSSLAPKY